MSDLAERLRTDIGRIQDSDGKSILEQQSGQTATLPIKGELQHLLTELWAQGFKIYNAAKNKDEKKLPCFIHSWAGYTEVPDFARKAATVLGALKSELNPYIEGLTLREVTGCRITFTLPCLMNYTAQEGNLKYHIGFRVVTDSSCLSIYPNLKQELPSETSNLRKALSPTWCTRGPQKALAYLFRNNGAVMDANIEGINPSTYCYEFRTRPILIKDLPAVMKEVQAATEILERPENVELLQYAVHLINFGDPLDKNVEEKGREMEKSGLSLVPLAYAQERARKLGEEAKEFLDKIPKLQAGTLMKYLL